MTTAEIIAERQRRKERLAASFRLFGRFGFDEGVAGHITARDPERLDHFWVNPFAMNFKQIKVSDLLLVNDDGDVVEGDRPVNRAAFAIHSQVHAARPDVIAAAHSHSVHGKAFSSLGRLLDPITQDSCIFYDDHALFDDFTGVVLDTEEGKRIADALGDEQGRHPAQPRPAHRRPLRRRGRLLVHHDGAHLPGPAARAGRRRPDLDRPRDGRASPRARSAPTAPGRSASAPSGTGSPPRNPTSSTDRPGALWRRKRLNATVLRRRSG